MATKDPFFICPECRNKVDLKENSIFCLKCGINLTLLKKLPQSQTCPKCREPGIVTRDVNEQDGYRRLSFEVSKCGYCGFESKRAHGG